jgi:type IV pilus assembly protein PilY1
MTNVTATDPRSRLAAMATLLFVWVMLAGSHAQAQSTDLTAFESTGAAPNIAIVLDTSGSMNKNPSGCSSGCDSKYDTARDAIATLVTTVNPPDGSGGYENNARFGLFSFSGPKYSCGAYLHVAVDDDTTADIVATLPTMEQACNGPKGICGYPPNYAQSTPLGATLVDIGRYFAGSHGWGTFRKWGDLSTDHDSPSPIDVSCRENFVVYLSDGLASSDEMDKHGRSVACANVGDADGDGNENVCNRDDGNNDWFDDVAHAMYRNDFSALPGEQNVVTHVIGFDIDFPLLSDAASHGGGTYQTADDSASLVTAFLNATGSVFEGLVSFTSATVPSSRTAFEDAFFSAYFDANTADAFWAGHLQAYRISPTAGILDKDGNAALNADGTFVDPRNPVWDAAAQLLSASHPTRTLYATQGGTRQFLTSLDSTELGLSGADWGNYPNDQSTDAITSDNQLRDRLHDYIEGQDAFDEDRNNNWSEKREAVLGDIFHSSPILIGRPPSALGAEDGFGPASEAGTFLNMYQQRDRILYAGANDGMLHAFDAGSHQTGDNSLTPETETEYYDFGTGNELWGWIPSAVVPNLKYMPINTPRTYYYVDGSPTAADAWLPTAAGDTTKEADEWTTVMITGMREGGAGYLALDVTDPNATTGTHGPYPKLLWDFNDPNEPLADAWSEAIITRIKVEGALSSGDHCGADDVDGDCVETWVAIFAGGYEETGDGNHITFTTDPNDPAYTTNGQAIFIVDLKTGAVLARLEYDAADSQLQNMIYAMPSTPAVLDLDFDGFADVIYVGDLGGQRWKWDISEVGSDDGDADSLIGDTWDYGIFFSVPSVHLGGGLYHYRSFFFPPSATFIDGNLTLAFASGERANLQYTGNPSVDDNNRLYVIQDDDPTGSGSIPSTPYTEADLTNITAETGDTDLTDEGFFIVAEDGEKFVSNHLIFGGFLITTSYSPTAAGSDPCSVGAGVAYAYIVDLEGGTGFFGSGSGTSSSGRRLSLGSGVPADPQISVSSGASGVDSTIVIQTSTGAVLEIGGPGSGESPVELVYWKQDF